MSMIDHEQLKMHLNINIISLMKLTSVQQIIQKHNVKSNERLEDSKVESVISIALNLITLYSKLYSYHDIQYQF